MTHPALDLAAAVRVLNDGQAWEIGLDRLDIDTYLAGGEAGGALLDLTPHLVEAQWAQGTGDAVNPDGVIPRGEAGVATLTLWDPTGRYLPAVSDPLGGIRPGRRIVIYERDPHGNPGVALWAGWVEKLERETPADGPGMTVITAVDTVTKFVNSPPTPPNARPPESPHDRAVWASTVLAPQLPALLDPDATASDVAGTQAGDSAWKTLVDAADVELGALFTLRDGTLVMLANGAGEFTSGWRGTWTYGRRDALLPTAAWWVDPAAPTDTGDGLRDLTGRGRDALFGEDAAAPLVLPWDGENYVYHDGDVNAVTTPRFATFDPASSTLVMEQDVMVLDDGSGASFASCEFNSWFMYVLTPTRRAQVNPPFGMSGGSINSDPLDVGRRYVLRAEVDLSTGAMSLAVDGTVVASNTVTGTFAPSNNVRMAGQGVAGRQQQRRYYRTTFIQDGIVQHEMLPANVSGDYLTIPNTGSAGGTWTIFRADDGFKTAVVDRPMLLFGGGQTLTSPAIPDGTGTLIHSVRQWPGGPADLISVHDGSPVVLDGTYEHLGSALFDRTLSASELIQVGEELLSDHSGQIRIIDLGDTVQVTVSPTPTTGTWQPPTVGEFLSVTRPQESEFHIRGRVLTPATPDGHGWTFTIDKTTAYWPGEPTPGTIIEMTPLDWETHPPGTPQWVQPQCSPVRLSELTYDLASLRNDVHVRRRDTDSDLTPFTQVAHQQSIGHYNRWSWRWDGSPHDTAVGELRAAALTISLYALPRAVFARLEANITAGMNTEHADTLLQLVREVNLSNTISVQSGGVYGLARVFGWEWTWTAAGGMSGQITLGRPPGDVSLGRWFIGVDGLSELDETTVLA